MGDDNISHYSITADDAASNSTSTTTGYRSIESWHRERPNPGNTHVLDSQKRDHSRVYTASEKNNKDSNPKSNISPSRTKSNDARSQEVRHRKQSMHSPQTRFSNQSATTRQDKTTPASSSFSSSSLPQHVALICDGNARWAQARNLPTIMGHTAGADQLVQVIQAIRDQGIPYCTLYAFSTENWQRPSNEIHDIMQVMEITAKQLAPQVSQNNLQIRILGNLQDDRIPTGLRTILTQLQEATDTTTCVSESHEAAGKTLGQSASSTLTICLAINYGGRQDILQAAQQLAHRAVDAMLGTTANDQSSKDESQRMKVVRQMIDEWQEDDLAQGLSTHDIPSPDLLIRTSGEHRLSNFMLWDLAYTEMYFTDTLWPDFDTTSLLDALTWYTHRRRRFGTRLSSSSSAAAEPQPHMGSSR
jgi:undecaprenyl diphosphate synthase